MRLSLLFLYTFCLAMSLGALFPFLRLLYFVPFLVLSFYRCSLPHSLWWAIVCGFVMDLFSTHTPLGIYALIYSLTTAYLYRYQFHFFEDRLSTLPVMTFCFACLSTLIQIFLFSIMGHAISLSWNWFKHDVLWMPLQDALYAILAFTIPTLFFSKTNFHSMQKRNT